MTRHPADENMPSWPRDGRFPYYSSNRTGRNEIWRVAAGSGTEEQVTREGGFLPFESLDGRTLYYKKVQFDGPLFAGPTAGGGERIIAPCVDCWDYAVDRRGVFYVECATPENPPASRRPLRHWDAPTGRDREVATLDSREGAFIAGLSASPDGATLLYAHARRSSDLMMIDNLR